VMGMSVYNGKLYAGTLPFADVYRYEGGKNGSRQDDSITHPTYVIDARG